MITTPIYRRNFFGILAALPVIGWWFMSLPRSKVSVGGDNVKNLKVILFDEAGIEITNQDELFKGVTWTKEIEDSRNRRIRAWLPQDRPVFDGRSGRSEKIYYYGEVELKQVIYYGFYVYFSTLSISKLAESTEVKLPISYG